MSRPMAPRLSLRASQTAPEASQAVHDGMPQQRRQRPSCAVLGQAGHSLHAGDAAGMLLPKSTGGLRHNCAFWLPPPPGGRGLPGLGQGPDSVPRDPDQVTTPTPSQGIPIKSLPRLRPKGSRSSHYLDSVPRDPDQVTTSLPPHRAHRPCVALETGPGGFKLYSSSNWSDIRPRNI